MRFNDTVISTAFFQLGLAEHFLPSFPNISLPNEMIDECISIAENIKENKNNISNRMECIDVSLYLQKQVLCQLFGIAQDEDIDFSIITNQNVSNSNASKYTGFYVCEDDKQKNDNNENSDKSPESDVSTNDSPNDDNVTVPRKMGVERTLSFDSNLHHTSNLSRMSPIFFGTPSKNDDFNITKVESNSTSSMTAFSANSIDMNSLSKGSGVFVMKSGQNILDVDSVPGFYVVLRGHIKIITSRTVSANSSERVLGGQRTESVPTVTDGGTFGHIALLSGTSEEWYGRRDGSTTPALTAIATCDTWLLKVPIYLCMKTLKERPLSVLNFSERGIAVLPEIIRLFDFCTKRVHIKGGDDLVTEGSSSNGVLYVVLSGRLKTIVSKKTHYSIHEKDNDYWAYERAQENTGNVVNRGDGDIISRGSLIGDIQLLTGLPYSYTARAIRYTVLNEIPLALLDFLTHTYPTILTSIARHVSDKQHKSFVGSDRVDTSKAFMVLPISGSVPLELVSKMIQFSLSKYVHKVKLVTSANAAQMCGRNLDTMSDDELIFIVGSWIQQMEMEYDIVIYQADWHPSAWNRICGSQCDDILLVANALDEPEVCHYITV
jgi:CRP-like cAMP-binding protein